MDVIRGKDKAKYRLLASILIIVFMAGLICYDKCCGIDPLVNAMTRKAGCYNMENEEIPKKEAVAWRRERRSLSGLGSSPPRCISRCGKCSPCKPVHVTVAPGTPVMTEYYPEAWRCKCGNKLYMP